MKSYMDIRVVGNREELIEFGNICKVIQTLGEVGANRSFKVEVDGDGSGKLSFYLRNAFSSDHKETIEEKRFGSEGIDIDKLDEMDLSIGE